MQIEPLKTEWVWKIYICQEIVEVSLTIVARLFLSLATHINMREKS